MADDIAALIKHLGLTRADIVGCSLGGGVALQTAIRHPEVVGKLVLLSTPFRRNAFYPEILAQQAFVTGEMAEAMKPTPMYQLYHALAPRPEDFPRLLTKIGEAMKVDFDFSKEIAAIKAQRWSSPVTPTSFRPHTPWRCSSCSAAVSATVGGMDQAGRNRDWRFAGLTHYVLFSDPAMAATVIPFLDE